MRWALTHLWRPVGAGVMPEAEVRFLVDTLFGGDDGRAAATRIDERVARLPGLAGLRLVPAPSTATRPAVGRSRPASPTRPPVAVSGGRRAA